MRISKWGNSLGVRLPKNVVDELDLSAGDELFLVTASKTTLVVDKAKNRKNALERMARRDWKLPEGYKFDREEANKR
jgi:antitoxin MazE